jgi:siderophore synthetase component
MLDRDSIRLTLQQELELLHRESGELLLQSTLNHADVHTEWDQVDDALRFARDEINRLGDHSEVAAHEIAQASRQLLEEIKSRLDQLRRYGGARTVVTLTEDFKAEPPRRPGT